MELISKRLGILGGGQLGKMLAIAAADWHLPLYVLDKSKDFPAGSYVPHFIEGDFNNYDDVMAFGQMVDVLTIEIEHVNTKALLDLQKQGKEIHPKPESLQIIQDKGLQKQFYTDHQFPTTAYKLYDDENAILNAVKSGQLSMPFVQKARTGGYDGRGVQIVHSEADLELLLQTASLVEDMAPISKELAVIAARSPKGEVKTFDTVEMHFDPNTNLVDAVLFPSAIDEKLNSQAQEMAARLIEAYDICGLLAVEFFLTNDEELLINEVAPRPHNSGHHSIEACITSQFQQHIRACLNLPLGATDLIGAGGMFNITGTDNAFGTPDYQPLSLSLDQVNLHVHIYGKKDVKPARKMGHATIIADTAKDAIHISQQLPLKINNL